jgi:hypothetical protein
VSNALAIATVTGALKVALLDAVGPLGASVTTLRPASVNGMSPQAVNIFLYQVTPNAAMCNDDLPTRRTEGSLMQRPRVALDLHYLLTFQGDETKLQPQRLLGAVARTLHESPVLSKDVIEQAKKDALLDLATSDLDDAIDHVRLRPSLLSLEELSKLWSVFFQTPYMLSATYEASVVLIESEDVAGSALPVLDRRLRVVGFNHPLIESVASAAGPAKPITAASTVLIQGRRLRSEDTVVLVGADEVPPLTVTDTAVTFAVSAVPAAALRAGAQGLQVVQKIAFDVPSDKRRIFQSNVAAFVLHPTITPGATTAASVTLTVEPPVRAHQRVILLLDQLGVADPASHTFVGAPATADTPTITVPVAGVAAGDYLVRLQIDGAESPVSATATGGPYDEPKVTVP